jgi:hypothetical protein
MSTIYYELNTQIEEHRNTSSLVAPLVSNASAYQPFTLPPQSQILYDCMASVYHTSLSRIRNGETNAKGVVFIACAIARVDALVAGADAEAAVLKAAKKSIVEVREIMAQVYEQEHGKPIDLSTSRAENKNHGRGEGADDVTGQHLPTGTGAAPRIGLDMDPNIANGMANFDADLNIGSQSIFPDDVVDFDFRFTQDPEQFFDISIWGDMNNSMGFGGLQPFNV